MVRCLRVRPLGVLIIAVTLMAQIALLGSVVKSAPTEQFTIFPGRGIGPVSLRMTEGQLRQLFPSLVKVSPSGDQQILTIPSLQLAIWFRDNRVNRIRTTNPVHKTLSGFGPGQRNWVAARDSLCQGGSSTASTARGFEVKCPFSGVILEVVADTLAAISVVQAERLAGAEQTPAPEPSIIPPGNTLIVPGQSIGAIFLRMSKKQIKGFWGEPDRVETEGRDRYIYDRFSTTVAFSWSDAVETIRTWNGAMRTKDGLGVGSSWSDVRRVFGPPQDTETRHETILEDLRKRIGFIPPGWEYTVFVEELYHTRGISFIFRRKVRYLGQAEPAVPIGSVEPVTHVTVDKPR